METLTTLLHYLLRILPGIVLIVTLFLLTRPRPAVRIFLYVFTFILIRDAMTPLGLWELGAVRGWLWIRLSEDPLFLVLFGVSSLLIVAALYRFDPENRPYLTWFRGNAALGLLLGLLGCAVAIAPSLIAYRSIDVSVRGGPVSPALLLPILVFALLGNLFEETLFRGYVLGRLEERQTPLAAGVSSGFVFALCHVFLAITVTGVGTPLLLFTVWEGVIAGIVGAKCGLVPAALTHGGAVFLLSSGLF